jgi:antitoxin (DNA-binding transcriptional repressor) of toxin-antitoxin stability system
MKRIAIEKSSLTIQQLARIAESEPVILTRKGVPVLGIVGVEEADLEAWSLGSNPDFLAMIERFRTRGRREGGIPLDEVRRRLGVPRRTSETPRK